MNSLENKLKKCAKSKQLIRNRNRKPINITTSGTKKLILLN